MLDSICYAVYHNHMTSNPALARTWRTHNTLEMDGIVVSSSTHTVTLSREVVGGPLSAEVDGWPDSVERAVNLLKDAWKTEVLDEVLSDTPEPEIVPTVSADAYAQPAIGLRNAFELHRELGRLKVRDHYALAAELLARPVSSFATLSRTEEKMIYSYAYGQWGYA